MRYSPEAFISSANCLRAESVRAFTAEGLVTAGSFPLDLIAVKRGAAPLQKPKTRR